MFPALFPLLKDLINGIFISPFIVITPKYTNGVSRRAIMTLTIYCPRIMNGIRSHETRTPPNIDGNTSNARVINIVVSMS